jgi:hypothetical protein
MRVLPAPEGPAMRVAEPDQYPSPSASSRAGIPVETRTAPGSNAESSRVSASRG